MIQPMVSAHKQTGKNLGRTNWSNKVKKVGMGQGSQPMTGSSALHSGGRIIINRQLIKKVNTLSRSVLCCLFPSLHSPGIFSPVFNPTSLLSVFHQTVQE